MENRIKGSVYRDSYIGYNVWRPIKSVQYMETHKEFTLCGDSYTVYNVWRLL